MISLPITSTIAALLAILMFPLTLQVSILRKSLGNVTFGDADDPVLRRRIRAFGNFAEYTPLCLVLLALVELQGASAGFAWSVGALLLAGRLIHALGMLYVNSPAPRGVGMFMTYAAFLLPAGWMLVHFYA